MKRIKVAAVGTNGHQIIGLLKGLDAAQLVGIAEFDPPRLADFQKAHPEVMASAPQFQSLEEVLLKSDCELVSLCSARRDQQAQQILTCLAAGRHVLAEKPLCTSLEDLEKIRSAAQKTNRKVWAMLTMINIPVMTEFARLIASGELGEVCQVYAQKSYKFGGKRPQDRGIDGGIIQAAIHAVSFVRSTTGLEFTEIAALESNAGNPERGNLQMELAITARLSNGALCQITSNYLNPGCAPFWGNDQLRIFGTRGMVEAVDGLTKVALYLSGGIARKEPKVEYPNYLSSLLEEIATGKPSFLTPRDSFRCTEIVLEAQASASKGGVVRRLKFTD